MLSVYNVLVTYRQRVAQLQALDRTGPEWTPEKEHAHKQNLRRAKGILIEFTHVLDAWLASIPLRMIAADSKFLTRASIDSVSVSETLFAYINKVQSAEEALQDEMPEAMQTFWQTEMDTTVRRIEEFNAHLHAWLDTVPVTMTIESLDLPALSSLRPLGMDSFATPNVKIQAPPVPQNTPSSNYDEAPPAVPFNDMSSPHAANPPTSDANHSKLVETFTTHQTIRRPSDPQNPSTATDPVPNSNKEEFDPRETSSPKGTPHLSGPPPQVMPSFASSAHVNSPYPGFGSASVRLQKASGGTGRPFQSPYSVSFSPPMLEGALPHWSWSSGTWVYIGPPMLRQKGTDYIGTPPYGGIPTRHNNGGGRRRRGGGGNGDASSYGVSDDETSSISTDGSAGRAPSRVHSSRFHSPYVHLAAAASRRSRIPSHHPSEKDVPFGIPEPLVDPAPPRPHGQPGLPGPQASLTYPDTSPPPRHHGQTGHRVSPGPPGPPASLGHPNAPPAPTPFLLPTYRQVSPPPPLYSDLPSAPQYSIWEEAGKTRLYDNLADPFILTHSLKKPLTINPILAFGKEVPLAMDLCFSVDEILMNNDTDTVWSKAEWNQPATLPRVTKLYLMSSKSTSQRIIVIKRTTGVTVGAVIAEVFKVFDERVSQSFWDQIGPNVRARAQSAYRENSRFLTLDPSRRARPVKEVDFLFEKPVFAGIGTASLTREEKMISSTDPAMLTMHFKNRSHNWM